jgi:HK97 family phage prohead protease
MAILKRSAARPRVSSDGFAPGDVCTRLATDDVLARFAPSSYDEKTRTIEAVFSTGARVSRWGVYEELAITPEAVDLGRVALGQVRFLDSHNQYSSDAVLGVVESAYIEGGELRGRVRFADTEIGRRAEGMVLRGEMTGLSVGYRVTTWTLTSLEGETEIWRADKWELLEVSLVSVPADPQASFRSAPAAESQRATAQIEESDDMRRNVPAATPPASSVVAPAAPSAHAAPEATRTEPAPGASAATVAPAPEAARATSAGPVAGDVSAAVAAERARVTEIHTIGTRAGMADTDIRAAVESGLPVDAFRTRAFEYLAAQANASRSVSLSVTRDETQTRMDAMTDALTIRIGGPRALPAGDNGQPRPAVEGYRDYVGMSLAEMAATAIGHRQMPRDAAQREEVLRRAFHTTSDFPIVFEGSINRVLAARYGLMQPTYRRISAKRNFRDFRPHDQIRVGDFPMLQKVGESGEIKFGTFGESKETIAVAPYAIQFALSRRMLIDDNIGAIDQVIGSYGDTVARFEETTFYAMKGTIGPVLLEDNKAVFHADHGNLAAAGTAIDTTSLGKGRAAMRKQKNQSGATLNVVPRILLVGPDKETEADMAVAAITPTSASNVNPFSGKLEVVSGPIAGNAWELYADPAVLPVWVWGMLDGYTAPRLRIDNPFGVQGVGVSLEHDFGAGAIDFRGAYRNPGA